MRRALLEKSPRDTKNVPGRATHRTANPQRPAYHQQRRHEKKTKEATNYCVREEEESELHEKVDLTRPQKTGGTGCGDSSSDDDEANVAQCVRHNLPSICLF